MLLYLLKVLLHIEQANCMGPTRIWAGVGIQNLLSELKEYPWKFFFMDISSLRSKTSASTSESPLLGNPMCKATATSFSSLTPTVLSFTSISPSFNVFFSVNLLRRGKHWIVSFMDSLCWCCCWGNKLGSLSTLMGFVSWTCWVTEELEREEEDEEGEGEEDGLSHSMKFGAWKQRFMSSTW